MVVEGVNALPVTIKLAEKYEVDMSITKALNEIECGKVVAFDAVKMLMCRERRQSFKGLV